MKFYSDHESVEDTAYVACGYLRPANTPWDMEAKFPVLLLYASQYDVSIRYRLSQRLVVQPQLAGEEI